MLVALGRPHGGLKAWQQAILLLFTLYLLLFRLLPALQNHYNPIQRALPENLDPRKHGPIYTYPHSLTTNLIIASTAKDNISWTENLESHLPNLKIYRYMSDTHLAQYRPPVLNKGREALMYFTYLRDNHHLTRTQSSSEGLADINIFIHAEEAPWHADPALMKSMSFTLAHLNLTEVLIDGYINLRTSWGAKGPNDCPDGGFNTSMTYELQPDGEERFMGEAFAINFPGEPVPELLAGPCCSQFAVSRDAIRRKERAWYERTVQWLVETEWPDQLVGRVWEHMWPWLFKGVARDCEREEWRTLCGVFGVCFAGGEALEGFEGLWAEREALEKDEMGFWKEVVLPGRVRWAREMVEFLGGKVESLMFEAVERGRDRGVREESGKAEGVEPG